MIDMSEEITDSLPKNERIVSVMHMDSEVNAMILRLLQQALQLSGKIFLFAYQLKTLLEDKNHTPGQRDPCKGCRLTKANLPLH